ncbi:MAG: primosomal protein N' [Acidobacteriaceae bacterium]|nr:primosomal protein N' [Acidobacteriaceae bacterium]
MNEGGSRYCDVALPVPLDRLFTYALPADLRESAREGCRVRVPLGSRTLTGVLVRMHNDPPEQEAREVRKLLDEEPVLDAELLTLGRWISEYYCAPIGEVVKGMLPLAGEVRRTTMYCLSDAGRDVARQLTMEAAAAEPALSVLRLLEERARPIEYLAKHVPGARQALQALLKRRWVTAEERQEERDPLRASAERLMAQFVRRPPEETKLRKDERELLAFLELHPGPHQVAALSKFVKKASEAARSLARHELIRVETETFPAAGSLAQPVAVLNGAQEEALRAIRTALQANRFQSFLLQGVTGSGKTEVYLRGIEAVLAMGKNALLLVPEIALTPAVAGQFFQRFGKQVAILHSAFADAERAEQWRRVRSGQARVVVGTRSGVFAPIRNLGLIVIDEEHDGGYKQQETPRYHGRDVALVRAKEAGAIAILGSATPSVETRYNAEQGKHTLLLLPERIAQRPLPGVEIIDMREEFLETKRQEIFSRKLLEEMQQRIANHEQTILLLNRRGFSSFMVCRACGERLQCTNCSVVLTHHRGDRRMLCHYCGYAEKVPVECPKCGSDHIQFLGTGSERVEDELHRRFPEARIARLDRDSASAKGAYERILQAFREGEIDILTGTQMIAKGHDVPNVTLVGVVLADIGLSMPDFRAAERSFQLLTQAAGRAGRGEIPGRVVVQTLNPDHYAVRFAARQDYEDFYKKEIEFRKWLHYPPFSVLANVLVRAERQEEALRMATQLEFVLNPAPPGIRVVGPAQAPILRLKNEFRYQILLKAATRPRLREVLNNVRSFAEREKWHATALVMDVDPISLM